MTRSDLIFCFLRYNMADIPIIVIRMSPKIITEHFLNYNTDHLLFTQDMYRCKYSKQQSECLVQFDLRSECAQLKQESSINAVVQRWPFDEEQPHVCVGFSALCIDQYDMAVF